MWNLFLKAMRNVEIVRLKMKLLDKTRPDMYYCKRTEPGKFNFGEFIRLQNNIDLKVKYFTWSDYIIKIDA